MLQNPTGGRGWWALAAGLALMAPLVRAAPSPSPAASDAVLLEENMEIEIRSPSEAVVRFVNRTQVLTEAGAEEYAQPSIYYSPAVEIRDLRASTTSPTGKRAEVKKQMISDDAAFASFELYSDSRRRVVHFPGAVPGAILEYRYEEGVKNLFYLPNEFTFQEAIPARLKTLTVRYPSGYPLRIESRRGAPEPKREENGGWITLRWEARDLSPLRYERGMPPFPDVVTAVSIHPGKIGWDGDVLDAESWDGLARWIRKLYRDRMNPTPEVRQMAASLAPPGTAPPVALRNLYDFARKKVNYVAVELGIGGLQPHSNGEVFQHRYGDCKDKATLLIAMLRAVDLTGFPVLIRTRDEGHMDRDYPSLTFNHAIVAVPQAGGYQFLDPTSESTPMGELPWMDQGAMVLVVKDDGTADVTETPLAPPEQNRRNRAVDSSLALNGDLEGTITIDSWGSGRNELEEFQASAGSTESSELVQDLMGSLSPGAVIRTQEMVPPPGPNDPFRIRVKFQVPRLATRSGSIVLLNPQVARFPFLSGIGSPGTRTYPLFFKELFLESAEARIRLPAGMTIKQVPKGKQVAGPGLTTDFGYELLREEAGQVLVVRRSLRATQREVPASDFAALRQFLDSVSREEASALNLVPAD